MIPKTVLSTLKSIVIFFPILTGAILTGLGTVKLGEANLVSIEQWQAPHGLLVFSSVQLESAVVGVSLDLELGDVERNIVPAGVEFGFNWDWGKYGLEFSIPEEVVVGVQFPFKITNYKNFEVILKEDSEQIISLIDKRVIVMEEQGIFSSIFYVRFNPLQEYTWQYYALRISFDLEGAIRQESFSVFTVCLPVVLGLEPDNLDYPYEQCQGVNYVYYSESLELTIGVNFPWDFEIKQIFPSSDVVMTEIQQSPRAIFIEPHPYSGRWLSGKALQMIMVEFEVSRLAETRDRLLFDSGLYMGLGVGLLFSGIHEAFKVVGELSKKKTKKRTTS